MSSLTVAAKFDGTYKTGVLRRMEIREGIGVHALALLDFPVPRSAITGMVPENTPVTTTWGHAPIRLRRSYAYVNHRQIVETPEDSFVRYFCVGASRPMNDPTPSSWTSVSASFIAKEIAKRHRLRTVVSKSDHVIPYWAQGTESDFAMLNRLAERVGFWFWVDGTTLYFVNPMTLLRRADSQRAPRFKMNGQPGDTLFDLQVETGSEAPGLRRSTKKRIYGIDANTGALIQSSSTRAIQDRGLTVPSGSEVLSETANSLEDARRLTEGFGLVGAWSTARATVSGTGAARIGGLVRLEGERVRQEDAGLWVVSAMTHIIERLPGQPSTFVSHLTLIRNKEDQNVFTHSAPEGTVLDVPAVIRHDRMWESAVLEDVYV